MEPSPRSSPLEFSDEAWADLARLRFWAYLGGAALVIPVLWTAVWMWILLYRRNATANWSLFPVLAGLGTMSVLLLLMARNLTRFARGHRPALASAFRTLRLTWVVAAVAQGAVLLTALWLLLG